MGSGNGVRTRDTTTSFKPVTDWIPATTLHRVTGSVEISGPTPSFLCRLAYRTAVTSPQSNSDGSPPEWFDPGDPTTLDDGE